MSEATSGILAADGRRYAVRAVVGAGGAPRACSAIAIIVNPKFAAERPEAVKGFLRAYLKGLKETARNPAGALDSVVKRNEDANKATELERLRMALKDNILTPEVKQNGLGGIDAARFDKAVDQIALTYNFKAKPKTSDIFDPSFLPPEADRKVN